MQRQEASISQNNQDPDSWGKEETIFGSGDLSSTCGTGGQPHFFGARCSIKRLVEPTPGCPGSRFLCAVYWKQYQMLRMVCESVQNRVSIGRLRVFKESIFIYTKWIVRHVIHTLSLFLFLVYIVFTSILPPPPGHWQQLKHHFLLNTTTTTTTTLTLLDLFLG